MIEEHKDQVAQIAELHPFKSVEPTNYDKFVRGFQDNGNMSKDASEDETVVEDELMELPIRDAEVFWSKYK